MYAIRSITVRYPERFENDFKSGKKKKKKKKKKKSTLLDSWLDLNF